VAYADDVTVILTNQKDAQILQRILTIYEKATGATINWAKSSALPIGRWDATQEIGEVRYKEDTKILGIYFGTTIGKTINITWQEKAQKIRHCMRDCTTRKLDIIQRLRICNTW
jgi:hypothetical protein